VGRILLLVWRYIVFHKIKTAIVISCITLTIYLPVTLHWLVDYFQDQLTHRAETTPLVVGAKGNRFDLALHALYFRADAPDAITMREVRDIRAGGLGDPIPLGIQFRARGFPIVGTSLEYFAFRGLEVDNGSQLVRLGDCLLGASVAKALHLGPGDRLVSDPENVFDISGTYPLNMRVTGVLAETHRPDDEAVFVDIKTFWIIQGVGHGHRDLATVDDDNVILNRTGKKVVAGAALVQYTEITEDNLHSFHFHGDPAGFPITACIVLPHDEKSEVLLLGRYASPQAQAQILEPIDVVEELMEMVFKVRRFFDVMIVLVVVSTVFFLVLVVLLSLRLRRREMETMFKLGCSRLTIFRLQSAELAIMLLVSFFLAFALASATMYFAPSVMRRLLF